MKGKKEDPNAQPRRGSQPKAPTGLNDETAVETHDLIHRAEEEEQKMHGSHALTQPDSGPSEGKTAGQESQSTMHKVKKALHMEK